MKQYDVIMGEAYERGKAAGVDAAYFHREYGEPIEMPSPLSGEWAGESISELFGLDIGETYDDTLLDDYEDQYSDGFATGVGLVECGDVIV